MPNNSEIPKVKDMGQTEKNVFNIHVAYTQSLHVQYETDLRARNMVLAHATLSCHDDHLCQIILNKRQS